MIGRHHLLLGGAAAALTTAQLGLVPWRQPGIFALALLTGGLAALLPDLDTRHNHLRRGLGLNRRRRGVAWPLRRLLGRLLDTGATLLPHRGPTHWLLTALLLAGVLRSVSGGSAVAAWLWPVFLSGYLSHLLADSVTRAGVPLLAPFVRRPVRLLPRFLCVRTGGRGEFMLVRLALLSGVAWLTLNWGWWQWPPVA